MSNLSFNPIDIPVAIITDIVSRILGNQLGKLPDGKIRRSLVSFNLAEPNFEEHLRSSLIDALKNFFEQNRDYKRQPIVDFFEDSEVVSALRDRILNGSPINYPLLKTRLVHFLNAEPEAQHDLGLRRLNPEKIIKDFFESYQQATRKHLKPETIALIMAIEDGNQQILAQLEDLRENVPTESKLIEIIKQRLQPYLDKLQPTSVHKISVFISYARKDATDFVRKLHEDLKAKDVDAWLDVADMPSGNTFIDEIDRAIKDADYFLLVFTPGAIASPYCRDEWKKAQEHYKPIIPLLLIGTYDDLPREANLYLNDAPLFTTEADYTISLEKLLIQIQKYPRPAGKMNGVPDLPRNYLPREDEIASLRDQLTMHKTTVLTSITKRVGVQGMGGIGKSVIATALTRDYVVRRTFSDGVFWLTFGTEPNLQENWIRLRDWFGGGRAAFQNTTEAADFFEQASQDRECLIILDDIWQSEHTAAFWRLGDRCRLLITSRHGNVLDEIDAHRYQLGLLNDNEARQLLVQTAEMAIDNLPEAAEGILEACGNLPLALAMIGAMVRKKPENYWVDALEALQEADLEAIAVKFPDYPYPNLFAAIEISLRALDEDLQERYYGFSIFPDDVPIPEAVLVTFWKPLQGRQVRKKLDELVQRNLLKRETDGSLIIHDLLLAFIRKQTDDLVARHQLLLNNYNPNGLPWHTIPHDGYLYEHLAYHLHSINAHNKLYHLLTDSSDWMNAKFAELGSDQSYIADIELALTHYPHNTPENILRSATLWATRQVVNTRVNAYSDNVLLKMALGDENDQQKALDNTRLKVNIKERFYGLLRVYEASSRIFEGLDELKETSDLIKDSRNRAEAYIAIGEALVNSGYLEEAQDMFDAGREIFQRISEPYPQNNALDRIVRAQAKSGYFEAALKTFERINGISYQISALCQIASSQAQAEQSDAAKNTFGRAVQIAQKIEGVPDQIAALCEIAIKQAKFGQTEEAKKTFNIALQTTTVINDPDSRDQELMRVASAQAESGDFDAASQASEMIGESVYKKFVSENIARKQIEAIQSKEESSASESVRDYLDTIQSIEPQILYSQREFDQVLSAIAIVQVKVGQMDTASLTAIMVDNPIVRVETLIEITLAHLNADQTEEAEQTLKLALATTDTFDKPNNLRFLGKIAVSLAQGGYKQKAQDILGKLLEMVNSPFHPFRSLVPDEVVELEVIAEIQAHVGQFSDALETAYKIQSDKRTAILGQIAIAQAQHELFDAALLTTTIIDMAKAPGVMVEIVKEQAKKGQFDIALQTIQRINEAYFVESARLAIAVEQAHHGQFDVAIQTAGLIVVHLDIRVLALSAIAAAQAKAGQVEASENTLKESLNIAHKIAHKPSEYRWLLGEIAAHQAEVGHWCGSRGSLALYGVHPLADYVKFIARGTASLESFDASLSLSILKDILRVSIWVHPSWTEAYELLKEV